MNKFLRIVSSIPVLTVLLLMPGIASMTFAQTGGPEQAGPYQTLVIRGVTIVDGSGAPAFGPADIFVQGNRITRVSLTDAITREEEKTNAAGAKHAVPDRVIDGNWNVCDAGADRFARTH